MNDQRPSSPVYAIGLDFGTAAARTLLLDLASGEEVALCELPYAHGVIDKILPGTGEHLGVDWSLHDPDDYIPVLKQGISEVLSAVPGAARHVIGIGLDATCCSVLPVTADGVPLCRLERWRSHPHAWLKLWKHHAAQNVASRLYQVAAERQEPFLARCGGRISSEWYFSKLIEMWLEDRPVYDATASYLEVADWLVWYLCGSLRRAAAPAAYKALWSAREGLPPASFFQAAFPGFDHPAEKLGHEFFPLGAPAGQLRPELAAGLGLPGTVAVAVGNIDAFASFPGAGAQGPGVFFMAIGTSACDLVVHDEQILLPGITGVAKDGIMPGLYGYEAGEAATGDMLGWYAATLAAAGGQAPGGEHPAGSLLDQLETKAARFAPGETGLVALDWWNGNRSVLADADLSGIIAGLTLQTGPAEIYRALLEAIAYGNTLILDNFTQAGFELTEIIACGGIAEKSPLLMQLIADVSGRPVSVPASPQVAARGSALFGAVAAGVEAGGFASIAQATRALRPGEARSYSPEAKASATYREIYGIFKALHDALGRDHPEWLHQLKRLKHEVTGISPLNLHERR
jgi:L-ribulokinase